MTSWVQGIIDYLAQNPNFAGGIIFAVAMGEALFVIGLFFPSTAVLVGAGTLVGLGKLKFWPVFLLTVAGAVVGDAVSYWFGHFYKDKIKSIWPFSKYPSAIERGVIFFGKHGGKSVFIGRFVPGVKAVVPGIAGMAGMDAMHFTIINVVSAFAWAAAHLFPAILAGATLTILGTMSKRLMIVVIIVLAIVITAAWLTKLFVIWIFPRFSKLQYWIVNQAAQRDGYFAKLIVNRFDPSKAQATARFISAIIIVFSIPAFLLLVSEIGPNESLVLADMSVANFIGGLRTILTDKIMIVFTMLGDAQVAIPVALATCVWLSWRHLWSALVGFMIAMSSAALLVPLLKTVIHRSRPIALYSGADSFSFPSGHIAISAALYGIIAYLTARNLPKLSKLVVYTSYAAFITLIGFSRVYLGAHWPSDVVGGLFLGLAVSGFYTLFVGQSSNNVGSLKFSIIIGGVFVLAATINVWRGFENAVVTYSPTHTITYVTEDAWKAGLWRDFAPNRIDLIGETEEPMSLQLAGSAQTIRQKLIKQGWQPATPVTLSSISYLLSQNADPAKLLELPTLHNGVAANLTMTKFLQSGGNPERLVLRIWNSNKGLDGIQSDATIYVGSIVKEHFRTTLAGVPLIELEENFVPDDVILKSIDGSGMVVPSTSPKQNGTHTTLILVASIHAD